MRNQLSRLKEIADLMQERELAELGRLARDRAAIHDAMEAGRAERHAVLRAATADPAHIAGAVDPWLSRQTEHLRRLSLEEARIAEKAEAQTIRARRAFGRAQALADLSKKPRRP